MHPSGLKKFKVSYDEDYCSNATDSRRVTLERTELFITRCVGCVLVVLRRSVRIKTLRPLLARYFYK